jgi:hypothetical protein
MDEWVEAQARLVDESKSNEVNLLLKRKYGLMKTMFDQMGRLSRDQSATLAIDL